MLKQSLQQKLLQKLSPQQIQLMKLLQVPTIELEQRIKEEMETNPALDEGAEEEDEDIKEETEWEEESKDKDEAEEFDFSDYMQDDDVPAYKTSISNKSADDDEKSTPYAAGSSFRENIERQLSLRSVTDQEELLAKTLIGNLDDDGYLRRDLENIVDDLAFSQNIMTTADELEKILMTIQELDPAGVGARSLQECLLIQLRRQDQSYPSVRIATEVIEKHFDPFTKKHYDRILKKLEISSDDLKIAVSEIVKLNPKPGNSSRDSGKSTQQIVPDFAIIVEEEELRLSLNGRNAPELKVSHSYREMMKGYAESKQKDKKKKEELLFVK
jgi:RNA polymerase sigma-54 factor